MQPAELLELRDDLEREGLRLQRLVEGLVALQPHLSRRGEGGTPAKGEGWLWRCGLSPLPC